MVIVFLSVLCVPVCSPVRAGEAYAPLLSPLGLHLLYYAVLKSHALYATVTSLDESEDDVLHESRGFLVATSEPLACGVCCVHCVYPF